MNQAKRRRVMKVTGMHTYPAMFGETHRTIFMSRNVTELWEGKGIVPSPISIV